MVGIADPSLCMLSRETMIWHRMNPLLLDLYACPTGQANWSSVLDGLCRATGACSAVVQLLTRDGPSTRSKWMVRDSASEAARALHDRYFSDAVNPRMRRSRWVPMLGQPIIRDEDLFEPDDPLYIDVQRRLKAAGLGRFMSVGIPFSEDDAVVLVLHRDLDDRADFNRFEERFALELVPHLRQAIQLSMAQHTANREAHDLRESINSVRCALVLCNADATVSWMNRAAEHFFAQRQTLWVSNERLVASSTQDTASLRRAIVSATQEPGEPAQALYVVIGDHAGRNAVHIKLQRIHEPAIAGHDTSCPHVLLMLSDPNDAPALPAELLRRLFALSPAEARLAAALCSGSTLNEYALEHHVSVGTARYQLKQIMAKTQVSRQAQLIQRLYSSVIAQAMN
jgi:DNA-binding CsgD family transcriptional regulator/PAS domain-containing protein